MSITALGSKEIEFRGLVGMGDYLSSVPSVSVLDQAAGKVTIVIRGLAANPQNELSQGPTVGVYFGEAPISGFGVDGHTADIKMVDLERVEVLRGPQGTLYGASSFGGTIRNIPIAPNLQETEGSVKVGYSNTADLGSGNSEFRGVINIPFIEDTLAVRVVAYHFNNSGFYKNVAASDPTVSAAAEATGAIALDRGDIGSDKYTGGRISVLWQPTDKFTANLTYLKQKIEQDGWPQADLELDIGSFSQRRLQMRRPPNGEDYGEPEFNEEFSDDIEIINATLSYDFGWASLLSSSSWLKEDSKMYREIASFFGFAIPWSQPLSYVSDAFIQEVRLASQFEGPFQFIAGIYYEDIEQSTENWGIWGGDLALNSFGDPKFLEQVFDDIREQKALFG